MDVKPTKTAQEIAYLANERRADAIMMIHKAKGGHTGGALSALDILSALHYGVMDLSRDKFLMSKGHSVEGYFAVLADLGFFPKEELRTFSQPGSRLIGHPSNKVPGVQMCTGALGHGLPVGVGLGIAAKRTGRDFRTFVLMGDGELAEGSIWEAAMAGAHYKLDNLFSIIDRNGLQISGRTENVMAIEPLRDKWEAFGWSVSEVDGHDIEALISYFKNVKNEGKPHCLIAKTTKGKGLPCAEDKADWHHHVPSEEDVKNGLLALGIAEVSWI